MDYDAWLSSAKRLLKQRRPDIDSRRLDPNDTFDAYSRGVSPHEFVQGPIRLSDVHSRMSGLFAGLIAAAMIAIAVLAFGVLRTNAKGQTAPPQTSPPVASAEAPKIAVASPQERELDDLVTRFNDRVRELPQLQERIRMGYSNGNMALQPGQTPNQGAIGSARSEFTAAVADVAALQRSILGHPAFNKRYRRGMIVDLRLDDTESVANATGGMGFRYLERQ